MGDPRPILMGHSVFPLLVVGHNLMGIWIQSKCAKHGILPIVSLLPIKLKQ